jgi:DNA-binding LacI/PurR family transcriptional regulator
MRSGNPLSNGLFPSHVLIKTMSALTPSLTTCGRRTRVALLIEASNAYARELLHGIQTYARENRLWAFHLTEQGRFETQSVADAVRQAAIPVVNVSAAEPAPECPTVISDSSAIARLAPEHLLERRFRRLLECAPYESRYIRFILLI